MCAVLARSRSRCLDSHHLGEDPARLRAEGVRIATELCEDLLAAGAPGLHFYTLNRSRATREIFAGLGYRPSLVYEKRRRTFRLDAAEIVLDELPFGDYMEIEADPDVIAGLEKLLGADEFEVVREVQVPLVSGWPDRDHREPLG